jgi:periplasmic protein TonB
MRGDLGALAQCLVESDAEGLARARRLRRKALVISVVLEVALIGVMLLWPLITPGVLPQQYVVTPAPPYHGGGGERANPGRPQHPAASHLIPLFEIYRPIIHPSPMGKQPDSSEQSFDGGPIGPPGVPGGFGPGPAIPGGSEFGPVVPEIPRPAPPKPAAPRPMSEGVMEAALIHRVLPEYPPLARTAHISGVVRLRAIIATDGSVRELSVLSGSPLLVQSALAAVREWRYRPTRLNGEAVEVETLITVNFVLNSN